MCNGTSCSALLKKQKPLFELDTRSSKHTIMHKKIENPYTSTGIYNRQDGSPYRVFVREYIGKNKVKLDTKSSKYYDAQKEWASLQGNAAYATGRMKLLAESWKVFWIKTRLNLTQEAANTVMRKKNENCYTQMQHYTTVRMEVPSAEYVENYLAKETQLNLTQEAANTMMHRKNENHQNQNTA